MRPLGESNENIAQIRHYSIVRWKQHVSKNQVRATYISLNTAKRIEQMIKFNFLAVHLQRPTRRKKETRENEERWWSRDVMG